MNNYRQDIDGLRGICVLAVVVFHVFPSLAPSGFLGVDIFFGISGYLICQLILRQLQGRDFSLFGFFASRIRRIFPALLLVFLFCVIVGSYLLPFDEFRQLNLHIATGSVFSSNFLLANELGYFDTASSRKPLLHLWSLAVEEQFYVVFPFAILLLLRLKWRIGLALLGFAVFSYAAGVYTAQSNADGAYFFSWCRFYEILAGASLAAGAGSRVVVARAITRPTHPEMQYQAGRLLWAKDSLTQYATAWSLAGLSLIVASFYVFDRNSPVPGSSTLLPLFGLLVLLSTGPQAWANRRILSARWLVAVGKISYPLYLWHWPVWVFISIKFHDTVWAGLVAIAASMALAALTYQYVERPVRNGRLMTSKAYVLILLMLVAGMVSLRTYETGMFRIVKNEPGLDRATLVLYQQITNQVNTKLQWTPAHKKVIIFGDSQAQDLFNAWKNDPDIGLMMANSGYFCSAFRYPDKDQTRHTDYCNKQFELLVNSEELKEADVLVYTHLWRDRDEFVPGYQEGLDRIRKANPKLAIHFMGPKPIIWKSYVTINAIMLDYRPPQSINDYLNGVRYDNSSNVDYARGLASKLKVGFIDAIPILCKDKCELYSGTEHYYYDQSHWTPVGTRHFYEKAAPLLSQLVKKDAN